MIKLRKDLKLAWDHEHGVASLFLTSDDLAGRCVDSREVPGDLVLHYDAEGHCVEAQFLDPDRCLPQGATAEAALLAAFEILAGPPPPELAG